MILTLAGAAISLAVLYANLRTWKKANWDPKAIGPFAAHFLLGALATVCVGGLLGFLAGCTVQGANGAGARAVPGATGTPDAGLARGTMGQLSPEGGLVVFLLTVALGLAWKASSKDVKKRAAGGLFCGATLCVTAGVASLLDGLPGVANGVGVAIRAALEGQGVL
ncbi:hypothetical protein [Streptomyces erythrochromogenes]|uniref:hypothetical protein n=1 Tax=Streptomyces erythrochromogenes TaxID=285574 RepID=UPI0022526BE4|nr:hypothetical protein [Streptomyces erythrochromogenes]MCX5587564.1 hypothetical protein [Streptomyces erythrochromogenes]